MLFVLFQLGADRYALDAAQVIEVMPMVRMKEIPRAPAGVAGVFNCRGAAVPVIDLSRLILGRPARAALSTRILLVEYPDAANVRRPLGLIAEKATETLRREAADFAPAGVAGDAAPYLGPVAADPRGLIQWIEPHRLLPAAVRDALFQQTLEAV